MKKYLVGGAVRDKLLGRTPKDQDWVLVGATNKDVQDLIAQGFQQVGADFPVFLHPETGEEHALARIERKTGVGYHGFSVSVDPSVTIEDDLARRDLTVNSIAMDEAGNIVDPFNGLCDLHNHTLRHTTEAFAEDPLRVLRLARFAARFSDWKIAPETIALCKQIGKAGELNHLSFERIWVEMEKGFSETSPNRFMEVLHECDALEHCEVLAKIFVPFSNVLQNFSKELYIVPKEQRLFVALGVLGRDGNFDKVGSPARVVDCVQNMDALYAAEKTADGLFFVLKKARALQNNVQFMDLVMAVSVIEHAGYGHELPFSAKQLMTGQHIIQDVKAAQFPELSGKELGATLDARRVHNLHVGFDIPIVYGLKT